MNPTLTQILGVSHKTVEHPFYVLEAGKYVDISMVQASKPVSSEIKWLSHIGVHSLAKDIVGVRPLDLLKAWLQHVSYFFGNNIPSNNIFTDHRIRGLYILGNGKG